MTKKLLGLIASFNEFNFRVLAEKEFSKLSDGESKCKMDRLAVEYLQSTDDFNGDELLKSFKIQ